MIRRLYNLAAVVALLNMTALTAAIGVFVGNGTLSKTSMQRVVAVLRGQEEKATEPNTDSKELPTDDSTTMDSAPTPVVPTVQSPEDLEVLRREAERIAAELEQRRALTQSALLNITTQREAFEKEREEYRLEKEAASKRTSEATRESDGFRKQVEIFDGLNPKVAMEHLLGMNDPTEAALILSALETRKANKIVEAAKTSNQQQKMQEIMKRIRDVAAANAVVPDKPGTSP